MGREEKGEGGDRGDLVGKRDSPKGVITVEMARRRWILYIHFEDRANDTVENS